MIQFSDYNITEKTIRSLLEKGEIVNSGIYQSLIERIFFINEIDIPRNILFNWNKNELLPYDNIETGWQKFSLIEFTWLKIIKQLRSFGLSLDKLKNIKIQLFEVDINVYKDFFTESIKSFDGDFPNKQAILDVFANNKNFDQKIWKEIFNEAQISSFAILILQILIFKENACLVIDENNTCSFIALQDLKDEKKKNNQQSVNNLIDSSFIIVNIRKILFDFFNNEKLNYDNKYLLGFLNKKERNIIELVRKGKVKEIKIKFKNDEIDLIESVNNENPDIAINKLARGFKKGEYKRITVQVIDGKVTNYETADLIKVNK